MCTSFFLFFVPKYPSFPSVLQLAIYIEACYAGSMFNNLPYQGLDAYITTAANAVVRFFSHHSSLIFMS